MDEKAGLLTAVIETPDDYLARLALADHLDETSADLERAKFIRVQHKLSQLHAKISGRGSEIEKALHRKEVARMTEWLQRKLPQHPQWANEDLAGKERLCFTPQELRVFENTPHIGWARDLLPRFRGGFVDDVTIFTHQQAGLSALLKGSPVRRVTIMQDCHPQCEYPPTIEPHRINPNLIPRDPAERAELKKLRVLSIGPDIYLDAPSVRRIAACEELQGLRAIEYREDRNMPRDLAIPLLQSPFLKHTLFKWLPVSSMQAAFNEHNETALAWQKKHPIRFLNSVATRSDGVCIASSPGRSL